MAIHVTPIPSTIVLAAPSFTLGLANAAGSAVTAIASDSSLLTFDTTAVDAITFGQSGNVGSATVASRRDHAHEMAADPRADISVLVFNDADQSIANATNTILAWDQELFDTDTMHDPTTNNDRLTATTGGKYFVFWQVDWASNAAGFREIVIELNGSGTQEYFRGSIPNLNLHAMSGFVLLALSSTDYVRLRVAQNSGGSLNVNLSASDSLKSFFGMVKILG